MRISKKEKELLCQAFEAPKPENRKAVLRKLPHQEAGLGSLILSQAAYVRKWVWMMSVLLFGLAVLYARMAPAEYVWGLSAFAPLLSISLLLELAKSESYGMAELEAVSRFSLKLILFARLGIIGLVHLLGLFLTAPVLLVVGERVLWNRAAYLLVPYLLTTLLGLVAVQRFRGRESTYFCVGISLMVSVVCPAAGGMYPVLYEERYTSAWGLAAVVLCLGIGKEYRKIITHWEDVSWN